MVLSVADYLLQLPESLHFAKVQELSESKTIYYRMLSEYGTGSCQLIRFEDDLLFILIADYTPKDTFEKVTAISEEYMEISQFETDSSSFEYLKEMRLNQALFLLKNSDYGIAAIAAKVGYHGSGHFAKLFKNAYGMGPKEYRKMYGIK